MTNRTKAAPKKPKSKKAPPKKNRFANIELPARGGDAEREGKKSVNWREDPEILGRLADVSELMNKNQPSWVIAAEMETSIATAKRDMSRVRELWNEVAKERLEVSYDEAIMQYSDVIKKALEEFEGAPKSLKKGFLEVVLRARERIDKVSGIADPIDIGNRGNKPFQTEDISKLREERWKQVSGKIQKVTNDNTSSPS